MKELVAVYGSLKSGYGNHGVMQRAEGKLISPAVSKDDHYVLDGNGYPYINEKPNDPDKGKLSVELYEVDLDKMKHLDQLEGHPTFYKRHRRTFNLPDNTETQAWLYVLNSNVTANVNYLKDGIYTW